MASLRDPQGVGCLGIRSSSARGAKLTLLTADGFHTTVSMVVCYGAVFALIPVAFSY